MLGLENDTMITVKIGTRSIDVPCYTMPGQARWSIGLVLGGGRTAAGHVGGREGKIPVGYATHTVRQTTGFDIALKATVTPTGKAYEPANIQQDHWDYRPGILGDVGKDGIAERIPELTREVDHAEFVKHKEWRAEKEEFFEDTNDYGKTGKPRGLSLFEEKEYDQHHRWGMAIDLSTLHGLQRHA